MSKFCDHSGLDYFIVYDGGIMDFFLKKSSYIKLLHSNVNQDFNNNVTLNDFSDIQVSYN